MKPTGVAILCAVAYLAFRIMLFMANMQHQVLVEAPFIPLFGLIFIGVTYVILRYNRTAVAYNWVEAFKAGGRVVLLSAVIASLGVWFYYTVIDPDYLELVTIDFYNRRKAEGFNEAQLTNYLEVMNFINRPFTRSTLLLSGMVALGLISSLMLAWMVKVFLRSR